MFRDAKKISKNAARLIGANMRPILSVAFAIYTSADRNFNHNGRSKKLPVINILGIAIVPLLAVCGIITAYIEVLQAIPFQLGGWNKNLVFSHNSSAEEIEELHEFVVAKKRTTTLSVIEVLVVQSLLTVGLVCIDKYWNLADCYHFMWDVFFYIAEAIDYIWNLQIQQNKSAVCMEKFQPRGIHTAFHRDIENEVQPVGDDQVLTPTIEECEHSMLEGTINFFSASHHIATATVPCGEEDNHDSNSHSSASFYSLLNHPSELSTESQR